MFMFLDEDGTYYYNHNYIIDIKFCWDNFKTYSESPDDITSNPTKYDIYLSDFSNLVIMNH